MMRLIISILLVALFISHPPVFAQSISDRYRAIVNLCEARKSAGILTDRQAALCRELIRAWEDRRSTRARELMDEAELELIRAEEIKIDAAKVITSTACFAEITRDRPFVLQVGAIDELALYDRFLAMDSSTQPMLSIHVGETEIERGVVPPRGWDAYHRDADRVRRVAGMAGRRISLVPRLDVSRGDAREWLIAFAGSRPVPPIILRNSVDEPHVQRDFQSLIPALTRADTIYLEFTRASGNRSQPFSEAVNILAQIPSLHRYLRLASGPDSRHAIFQEALTSLSPLTIALTFETSAVGGFTDGARFILANTSSSMIRVELEVPQEAVTAPISVATIGDNGSVTMREVTPWKRTVVLELPPRAVSFAALGENTP